MKFPNVFFYQKPVLNGFHSAFFALIISMIKHTDETLKTSNTFITTKPINEKPQFRK